MRKLNNNNVVALVSVRDLLRGRQANNLLENSLADSVRPWFSDWTNPEVTQALEELEQPASRERAAAYLGLEITAA
ncbi:hypothetical protein [Scrofimicrobium sp. R131]|uniref:Uncharacterized protein n=1 Tax=Scrofimicrobium appendicitidis TaxID=3079930 RepID=A0AAU7V5H1_9ACTO